MALAEEQMQLRQLKRKVYTAKPLTLANGGVAYKHFMNMYNMMMKNTVKSTKQNK